MLACAYRFRDHSRRFPLPVRACGRGLAKGRMAICWGSGAGAVARRALPRYRLLLLRASDRGSPPRGRPAVALPHTAHGVGPRLGACQGWPAALRARVRRRPCRGGSGRQPFGQPCGLAQTPDFLEVWHNLQTFWSLVVDPCIASCSVRHQACKTRY